MKIPIQKQVEFLNWQIRENEDLFRAYLNKPMRSHFEERTAFFGKIWGIDEARGNLIIRFDQGRAPRLNMPLGGFVFHKVPFPDDLDTWDFSYQFFRENHAAIYTDILPIYFINNAGQDFNLIGCKDVEAEFLNLLRDVLENGKHPSIVLAERDPPIKYLLNLRAFISSYPDDIILNLSIEKSLESWQPKHFDDQDKKEEEVLHNLDLHNEVIIQGPPGTGKSFLIAQIAEYYLSNDQSVCITALTNKALMEVAEKPGIKKWAKEGKVYKTNLALNESIANRQLKKAPSLGIGNSELLLATYYKLSDWYDSNSTHNAKIYSPVYDLLIIEEASQCYLATIAAFKRLGKKVLIVGDPLQLPPIVLNEKDAGKIHPQIMKFAHGLATYAANANINSFLLTQSYRLTAKASDLTGIFYNGQLKSVGSGFEKVILKGEYCSLIPAEGETKIKFMPIITEGDRPNEAIEFIVDLLVQLDQNNPKLEVAILAPFKNTVRSLQEKIGKKFPDQSDITIETIDRIQGLTVDFTIYLLALNNPSFAMNLNRFNVATSRAKRGTIIITDKEYSRFMGIDPKVTQYLGALEVG